MEASFDNHESMASEAELEKRLGEHMRSGRLSAAPSPQLDAYLATILASVGSRSAPEEGDQATPPRSTAFILVPEKGLPASALMEESAASDAGGEDAARLASERGNQASSSQSTALILVPEKGLLAPSVEKESAFSLGRRASSLPMFIYAGTRRATPLSSLVFIVAAVLIVIGPIVGGVSHLLGRRELSTLPAPTAVAKFEPPPETTAQIPAAAAVAPPPTAAGSTQPSAENAPATAEPPAGAPAEALLTMAALPATPKMPTADKSDGKSGKQAAQPIRHPKVAKHRRARAAHQGLTNLRHAVASFFGAVRGLLVAR
jgi:hypothetical protein